MKKLLLSLALFAFTLTVNSQKKIFKSTSETNWSECDSANFPNYLVEDRYTYQYLGFICSTPIEPGAEVVLHNLKNKSFVSLPHTGNIGKVLGINPSGNVAWVNQTVIPTATKFASYSDGTPYNFSTTYAKVTFGTNSPQVTLTSPGTYSIRTNILIGYTGLVSVGTRILNIQVRRTNNTAANLPNASTNFITPVAAVALTSSAGDVDIPEIFYTTTNSNDVLELWGSISAGISAGNIQSQQASITVTKISD